MIVDKDVLVPNALGVPARAKFLATASTLEDIEQIVQFAKKEGLPLIPLGEGTNTLPRTLVEGVVMILALKGISLNGDILTAKAGENWDGVVKFAVDNHLSGIEALSSIPGLSGAAPIQNIGAYGTEIKDTLETVEAYDKTKEEFVTLKNSECDFGYRDSIFKKNPGRFIVTSITLKLSKQKPKIPDYKDVKKYFEERGNTSPSLQEIREAIISIRKNKLPDPSIVPNAGSYFTNPILNEEKMLQIKENFKEVPIFPFGNDFKVPAGWLIEQVGLKGQKIGKIKIYDKNALVLTNPDHANFEAIQVAEKEIITRVFEKFNITLEREPRII